MGRACSTNGESRRAYKILVGKPEKWRPVGRPSINGKIILKWILGKWDGAWTGSICFRIRTGGGLL
jgi:hypothetical protein